MQTKQLGNTDLHVSSLGLGCVTFGREIDRDTSFAILDHALAHGITLLDTAEAYHKGASESILGEWHTARHCRDKITLATKVTLPLTRDRILAAAEDSLRRLRTDRIDLYQLHTWDAQTPLEETLDALQQLLRQGKVRHIGCSNFNADQLRASLRIAEANGEIPLSSVQPPYNLVQREIEADLIPCCRHHHLGILSYSPLAAGFLTGKYSRSGPVPEGTRFDVIPGHQDIYFHDRAFDIVDRLRELSTQSGLSMHHLALAWVLHQPGITSTLIGARTPAHIDQALAPITSPPPNDLLQTLNSLETKK